ncbi:MAG: hypothetical protein ACFFCS_08795 [Candidatus Hodarchaeota archaeon]
MLFQLNPLEFSILYGITFFIIIVKAIISIYIALKIKARKEQSKDTLFMTGILIMVVALLVSRILFFFFDFYLTSFIVTNYILLGSLWVWKCAALITLVGVASLIFITDKKIINFKLKGVIAYLVLGGMVVLFFYPVNTVADFNVVSTIFIGLALAFIFVFVNFVYIIKHSKDQVKKAATILAISTALYLIGSALVTSALVDALRAVIGDVITIVLYFTQAGFKVVGITLLAYGATLWG